MSENFKAGEDHVPFFKKHLLPQMVFFSVGAPKGSFGSVDVTRKCNLRCKHCYFYDNGKNSDKGSELTVDEWYNVLKKAKKKRPFFHSCTWVGGEPLIRKDVIEKCKPLFHHNLIVTNGTIPLPYWPDCYFHVSVDGTEKFYEKMRGEGIYKRVKMHASYPDLNVTAVFCITSINQECIEDTVKEWHETTPIKGFIFDFYTPTKPGDDPMWIDWEQRNKICDRLLALHKKYGDYIKVPAEVYEHMKKGKANLVTANCLLRKKGFALSADGTIKEKCILGPEADCSRCGCIVPYYLHVRMNRKYIVKLTIDEIRKRWVTPFFKKAERKK